MMRKRVPALVIAFDTTAQAIAAETLFTARSLPGRMIPIPSQISAGCGLAWKAEPEQRQTLLSALDAAGAAYATCQIVPLLR